MKTSLECMECNVKQLVKVSKLLNVPKELQEEASKKVFTMLGQVSFDNSNPSVMGETWKIIMDTYKNNDPYQNIKTDFNNLLMGIQDEVREIIYSSPNPFLAGLKIAVTGNLIDFAAQHTFTKRELLERIRNYDGISFKVNDIEKLEKQLISAKTLFYIGDNCGEIVLDKLFIELIKKIHPEMNVYFGVRGGPILNDVTVRDTDEVKMEEVAKVVSSGLAVPGVLLEDSSAEFKTLFNECDVVIAKGQGNYETLNDIKKDNLFLLLMVKCPYIARTIGVQTMDYIMKNNH